MPYYDYKCSNCKKKYTYLHHGSDDKVPSCPACASKQGERLISPTNGHILKGEGWARDNYQTKRKK
jgi:putative FmdB family regulatory protein